MVSCMLGWMRSLPALCVVFVAWLAPAGVAQPSRMWVAAGSDAGDEATRSPAVTHLWVLEQTGDDKFTLLHRHSHDKPGDLYHAFDGQGRILAAAAHGRKLYCVYASRSVQSLEFQAPPPPQPPIFRSVQLPGLPPEARVIDLAAGPAGPVALVHAPASAADPAARAEVEPKVLRLAGLQWEEEVLPAGLDPSAPMRLIALDDLRGSLLLTVLSPSGMTLHRSGAAGWTQQKYPVSAGQEHQVLALTHSGAMNVLLARLRPDSLDRAIELLLLRSGAATRLPAELPIAPDAQWWAVPSEHGLLVLTTGDPGSYRMTSVSFPEGQASDWATLSRTEDRPTEVDLFTMVVVAAVVIGTLVLLLSGKRKAEPNLPRLPPGTQPAALNRVAAAAVDFAPGLAVSMIYFGLHDPTEVVGRLIQRPGQSRELLAPLLAIVLHVAHTTATELFTASTIGKAICGCRVVNLSGGPPHVWQVLTRNAFKVLEMAMPFFLFLPLMSPTLQRLGDLIARTVVVTPVPPRQREEEEEAGPLDDFDSDR